MLRSRSQESWEAKMEYMGETNLKPRLHIVQTARQVWLEERPMKQRLEHFTKQALGDEVSEIIWSFLHVSKWDLLRAQLDRIASQLDETHRSEFRWGWYKTIFGEQAVDIALKQYKIFWYVLLAFARIFGQRQRCTILKDCGSFWCLRGFPSPLIRGLFACHLKTGRFEHDCIADFGKMLVRRHRNVSPHWARIMPAVARALDVDLTTYDELIFFFGKESACQLSPSLSDEDETSTEEY